MTRKILQTILLPLDLLRDGTLGLVKGLGKLIIKSPGGVIKIVFPVLIATLVITAPILLGGNPGYGYDGF